jgi:O-antigen polymerase
MTSTKQRWLLILGIVVFVALFQWAYINWLSPTFAFYGFEYYDVPRKYLVLAWICSVLPASWMPLKIKRPTQLAYWVLYLTVVIPSMFIPLFVQLNEPAKLWRLTATFFIAFAVTGVSYLCPLHRLRRRPPHGSNFWRGFAMLSAACFLIVVVAFWGKIRLVSFADIYDLRDAAAGMGGSTLNYALMWLYGAINPFLIAWGLYYKRAMMFAIGASGQLLIYCTLGTKASLLSIAFILGIYCLYQIESIPFGLKLTWSVVALFTMLCLAYAYLGGDGELLALLLFLVFFRSFGLAGLLTAQYYNFFQSNPHTLYSHIKIINLFVRYPFHYPLGTEIGYYYYNPLVDTTAHFWATDGIAAAGLPGVLVASVFCALVFWLIDSAAQGHDSKFAALAIFFATYNLANLSLFTTLLSGGLGLLIVFLRFAPPQTRGGRSPVKAIASRKSLAAPA